MPSGIGFFVLALSAITSATPLGEANLVARAKDAVNAEVYTNASWYSYNVGLGACGRNNAPSDFVVALNAAQYGKGEHCFKKINMSYQGKTTVATIVDECVTCPDEGLDLSQGLFAFFTTLPFGFAIRGDWSFLDE